MLRFGVFELDEQAGELRRNGGLVKLPPQPLQVLLILARNSGEVVDRDRLRREVWGETTVDFDRSLNVCIAQIRSALNDDAESPRFIQTLPRRGYRFVAPVEGVEVPKTRSRWWLAPAGVLAFVALGSIGYRLTRPAAPPVRLAVLPFDASDAQIDGIFDELLTRLGGIQPDRLRVIGRRSVMAARKTGQKLNVDYVVETGARAGLRVSARLVKTEDDGVLWSGSYVQDGAAEAFEERVVAQVSAAVLDKLFPGARAAETESGCRDGWESYRTARLLANTGTLAGLEKSLPYFEQAGCPAARVALADTWLRLARAGRREAWDKLRAVLPPDADLARANLAFWRDWDWPTAEKAFQAALRRRPSDPDAHHDYAWLLVALGRKEEGMASLQRAIALDPLSARVNMDAGWLYLQAGRFREAAAQARRALELDPALAEARACLSRALVYAGDLRGALDVIREESPERYEAVAMLPPDEAIRTLWRNAAPSDPYQRAWRLAWIGEKDAALEALEEALRARSGQMPMAAADPAFTKLHADERFRKIVRAMKLSL